MLFIESYIFLAISIMLFNKEFLMRLKLHITRVVSGITEHLRYKINSPPEFKTNSVTLGISN